MTALALTLLTLTTLASPAFAKPELTKKQKHAAERAVDKAFGDCLDTLGLDARHPDEIFRSGRTIVVVVAINRAEFYVPIPPKASGVTPAGKATTETLAENCAP